MTKEELAARVAADADISRSQAKEIIDATFDAITDELQRGGEVAVAGFGKFGVSKRSARQGRNPATGETIKIAASNGAKFSPASALKRSLVGTSSRSFSADADAADHSAAMQDSDDEVFGAWEATLGRLLTAREVGERLGGVAPREVIDSVQSHRLVGMQDLDKEWLFPEFQFEGGRPSKPLVAAFWRVAAGALSGWTAASWCVEPDEELGGRSPVEWLASGGDPGRLSVLARHDAARLAR